jgi:ankyrin repeat protein
MYARKTTFLIVLLISFSGASVAYLVKSQLEISTLKQRVKQLTQQLAQVQTQHSKLMKKKSQIQYSSISKPKTPLKSTGTVPDADTSLADEDVPLKQAVLSGDVEALRSLIKAGADLSSVYADGQSLLHLAAWSNDASMVALLIESGLDVSAVDDKGRTPLHFAASYGHLMTAQQLIELGANLEATDPRSGTPLMTAVRNGNTAMVDALIGAGANITVRTASQESLLHTAAHQADAETLTVLLNGGIDSNAQDRHGRTALHYAKADVVPLLVGAGIDVNQTDKYNNTPIYNALLGGDGELASALYAAGANGYQLLPDKDYSLSRAAQFGLTDLSEYLISNGADVNAVAYGNWTILDMAIKHGNVETATLLKSHGARSSLF